MTRPQLLFYFVTYCMEVEAPARGFDFEYVRDFLARWFLVNTLDKYIEDGFREWLYITGITPDQTKSF